MGEKKFSARKQVDQRPTSNSCDAEEFQTTRMTSNTHSLTDAGRRRAGNQAGDEYEQERSKYGNEMRGSGSEME